MVGGVPPWLMQRLMMQQGMQGMQQQGMQGQQGNAPQIGGGQLPQMGVNPMLGAPPVPPPQQGQNMMDVYQQMAPLMGMMGGMGQQQAPPPQLGQGMSGQSLMDAYWGRGDAPRGLLY